MLMPLAKLDRRTLVVVAVVVRDSPPSEQESGGEVDTRDGSEPDVEGEDGYTDLTSEEWSHEPMAEGTDSHEENLDKVPPADQIEPNVDDLTQWDHDDVAEDPGHSREVDDPENPLHHLILIG